MGKSYVATTTEQTDSRAQVESLAAGSQFIAGGATVANPGAVAGQVGNYSQLTQHYSTSLAGLTGDEVRAMLNDQEALANANMDKVTQLSSEAIRTSTAAVQTLATGRTPEPTDWTRYLPLLIVGGIGLALAVSGRRRRAA